eukprot:6210181-Pleurochrysis_carterae.AAC.4
MNFKLVALCVISRSDRRTHVCCSQVLPAFSVGDGAIIEANFGKTEYGSMPAGFQGIIKCQSLL